MSVRVCFDTEPPRRLHPGRSAARPLLERAYLLDGDAAGRPLPTDERGVVLQDADDGDCVAYVLALESLRGGGAPLVLRLGEALFTTTSAWLWGPDDGGLVEASLRLSLPPGVRAALPFARRGAGYHVPDSAYRLVGYAAFGRFRAERIPVPGAVLDVAWLGTLSDPGARRGWLQRAAGAVATLYGRFPVGRVSVVVLSMPSRERDGFGSAGRGGGASLLLTIGDQVPVDELDAGWVAVHEMSHLAVPYVRRRDAWLSEGLATYYQEVLRARGGLQTPEQAWAHLLDGFAFGARHGSGRTLDQESADVYDTFEFARVYWAGAALALLSDVELRTRTGGRASIDAALRELDACCRDDFARERTADELVRAIDRASGRPIMSAVVARWLHTAGFPDVTPATETLGLARDADGAVSLVAGPGAAVRDAIMAP